MQQSDRNHITLIMPTVDWGETFTRCLQAAQAALGADDEVLVVFDGVPPPPPNWLERSRAVLLQTGARSGPAAARNLAAQKASNPNLLFVDADVELHPDAIERVRAQFSADPDLAAIFGSYDDQPVAPGLVSRFRNLLHHHTHSSHPGPASTFWAGCGAVRRDRFLALGGFDAEATNSPASKTSNSVCGFTRPVVESCSTPPSRASITKTGPSAGWCGPTSLSGPFPGVGCC